MTDIILHHEILECTRIRNISFQWFTMLPLFWHHVTFFGYISYCSIHCSFKFSDPSLIIALHWRPFIIATWHWKKLRLVETTGILHEILNKIPDQNSKNPTTVIFIAFVLTVLDVVTSPLFWNTLPIFTFELFLITFDI